MSTKGIAKRKDPGLCMVVGCKGKAIYRKFAKSSAQNIERGYCAKHKDLARTDTPHNEREAGKTSRRHDS